MHFSIIICNFATSVLLLRNVREVDKKGNLPQPSNVPEGITFIPLGKSTSPSSSQPQKTPFPITRESFWGSLTLVRFLHPAKAQVPILITLSGISTWYIRNPCCHNISFNFSYIKASTAGEAGYVGYSRYLYSKASLQLLSIKQDTLAYWAIRLEESSLCLS